MNQQTLPNSVKNLLRFITARTEQSVSDGNGANNLNQGSGVMYFYRGHTYLLTAAHCVKDATKNLVNVECKINTDPVAFKKLRVLKVLPSVYDLEKGLDYAVLEIDNPNNGFLSEGSVRLTNFSTSARIDLPTATYGFLHWCREGRCFEVKPSDEGHHWEVDMPVGRREDFGQQIKGLSGAGVFNFDEGYFECLGVIKCTREERGLGHDVAITKALDFQGLIESQFNTQANTDINIQKFPPVSAYINRYCVQYELTDFMRYVHTDGQRFTLSDFLRGTVDDRYSILHYVLVAPAQTGKSYELKQTCHILSSEDIFVCFIQVVNVKNLTRESFPSKDILESGKKLL